MDAITRVINTLLAMKYLPKDQKLYLYHSEGGAMVSDNWRDSSRAWKQKDWQCPLIPLLTYRPVVPIEDRDPK